MYKYLKTFNESVDVKFTNEFIDSINHICLELTDINYKIDVKNSEQSFSRLKPGDFVMIDSLRLM